MEDFLKKWYEEKGPKWCAQQLDFSYAYVIEKARALNLSYAKAKQERLKKYVADHLLSDGWEKVANDLGVLVPCVRGVAKRFNLKIPPDDRGAKPTLLSDEQKHKILLLYPDKSAWQVAQETGLTYDIIIGFLKRESKYIGYARKISESVNKDFFNWSENFAYVLGYTMADGSVGDYNKHDFDGRNPRKLSQFSITSKDRQILDDIRAAMGLKAKPCEYLKDGETYYHLTTRCRWVYDQWKKYGVRQNKTYVGIGVPDVPEEYLPHFIRGFFDGDGHVMFTTNLCVGFGATDKTFISWIRDITKEVIGRTVPEVLKYEPQGKMTVPFYVFRVYCSKALALMKWMKPSENGLRLRRKWDLFPFGV